jgi:hypothetical protein
LINLAVVIGVLFYFGKGVCAGWIFELFHWWKTSYILTNKCKILTNNFHKLIWLKGLQHFVRNDSKSKYF